MRPVQRGRGPACELSASDEHVGLPALTSGGVAVTYSVVGNVLTATAGGTTVFTYTLDATSGNWAFKLLGQLDHPTSGTEDDLTINLGSLIQVTDKDGDKATLPATAVSVTVDDDMPVAVSGATSTGIVDEDGLPAGTTARLANRSIPTSTSTLTRRRRLALLRACSTRARTSLLRAISF